jgi:hypothetical protein
MNTMNRDLHDIMRRWLLDEEQATVRDAVTVDASADAAADVSADNTAEVAESALFELFGALPTFEPSPFFADQVLARARAAWRPIDLGMRARLLTAASLLLAASAVAFLLPAILTWVVSLQPAELLSSAVELLGASARLFVDLLRWSQKLAGIGRVVWLVATSPQVVAVLSLVAGATLLLSRWWVLLVTSDRSLPHAHAR